MKDYAAKQAKLTTRIGDLEVKVFGTNKVKKLIHDSSARSTKLDSLSPPVK